MLRDIQFIPSVSLAENIVCLLWFGLFGNLECLIPNVAAVCPLVLLGMLSSDIKWPLYDVSRILSMKKSVLMNVQLKLSRDFNQYIRAWLLRNCATKQAFTGTLRGRETLEALTRRHFISNVPFHDISNPLRVV